jgi:hypothetical protein
MNTTVRELRRLLGSHNESVVSVSVLQGFYEHDDPTQSFIRTVPTDDLAVVFLGPASVMRGMITLGEEDGEQTYKIRVGGDPPYIVSDERLMEIRQLLVHDEATPVAHATRDALAAAVFDLLAERDDRTV